MNLYLLTASHNQHEGFKLSCAYVRRAIEELPPQVNVAWIVADDSETPVFDDPVAWEVAETALPTMQAVTLRRPPGASGLPSFIGNMRELGVTLSQCAKPGDIAAVIEDDWFSATYLLHACIEFAKNPDLLLWGETRTRYYRITNRRYHVFNPNGRAALSGTVFRALWGAGEIVKWGSRDRPTMMLDDVLWQQSRVSDSDKILLPNSRYVVGIKGLPGTSGLGVGGRLNEQHRHDPDGMVLREWVGPDADTYLRYAEC